MFKKREPSTEEPIITINDYQKEPVKEHKANAIVKGSKLTGDLNITYDLELDGDAEGNITSEQKSNIVIKGHFKGNIKTKEGNVDIIGQMSNGDIIAGGDVKITGKFSGGKIEAKGKIYVNGEFHGKLDGTEVEIGSGAHGEGNLIYKEYISIDRGAKVEVQVSKIQESQDEKNKTPDVQTVNLEPFAMAMQEA